MNYNLHSKMIDALRGIAASAVFFSHSDASHLATNPWLTANKGFLGSFGVYMFFCLSGYLIWRSGTRLIGTPRGVTSYAIHRATRLVPLYLVNLFFVVAFVSYIGSKWTPASDTSTIVRHLFFTQDLYPIVSRAINPVLWTLTHEALFYIFAALMLMANIRNIWAILIAALTLHIACLYYGVGDYFKFSQVFYAFAFGIFIAGAEKNKKIGMSLLVIALAIYSFTDSQFANYSAPLSGIALAISCITLTLDKTCGQSANRLLSPFVFLGMLSYSLYIWHYQIINIMEYHYGLFNYAIPGWTEYGLVRAIVTITICVVISYISYVLIEKPSMGTMRIALEKKIGITPAAAH